MNSQRNSRRPNACAICRVFSKRRADAITSSLSNVSVQFLWIRWTKKVVERGARHDTRNICSSSGSDSRLKPLVSNFCSELPFHWYESLGEQRGEEIRYAFTYVHVNGKRYKSYQPWYNFPPRALLSRRRALLKLDEKLVLASSMKRSIKTFERNLSKDFYTCSSQFIFWDKIIDEQWRNNSGLRVVHV